jgi:hypothetical protein
VHVKSTLASLVLLSLCAGSAAAAVSFEPWEQTSFQDAVDRAAASKRQVVLVVTQPDWCPPCITLDRKWLKNESDHEAADVLKDAMVLEVRGYDADGAELLRKQGVLFQGTPTTHVFGVPRAGMPLGEVQLEGSVVGAPADWPAQVGALLDGRNPVSAARKAVLDATDPVTRAHALMDLGGLLAARGDANGATTAYRRVEWLMRHRRGDQPQLAELAELKKQAWWERVATVELRVRKDHASALRGIDGWVRTYTPSKYHPSAEQLEKVAYARAWALDGLGRTDEALDLLSTALPHSADGYETFLYFCFRSGDPQALLEGERRVPEAIAAFPERRAAFLEALGRIQRRQNRFADAETSFAEAVSLAPAGEERLTYASELETARRERAARESKAAPETAKSPVS